jgi:hypothetical protein
MKPYRIKHIPTGLYYKPGEVNLSKNGKIYQTGANILNYLVDDVVRITCRKDSKIHKDTAKIITWEPYFWTQMIARIPKNQFEKEEL